MSFAFESPRREADYRQAKPATASSFTFRCKRCKQSISTIQGRKRVFQGWVCAECAK